MRRVLVDDDQAVLRLGDDVGGGDLAAGDSEGIAGDRRRCGFGSGGGGVLEQGSRFGDALRHSRESGSPVSLQGRVPL